MSSPTPNKSVAIDPGYDRIGIAVFEGRELVFSECFEPPKGELPARLAALHKHLAALFKKHAPASVALETLFFSTNQKTAIKVAEARGVVELAAAEAGAAVSEYSPQAVKIAVTGHGASDKEAVTRMVERLIKLAPKKRLDDEYDAIALGIAHTASMKIHSLR